MKNIRKTFGLATIAGALAVAPLALATGTANADSGVNWDAVAACESGGDPDHFLKRHLLNLLTGLSLLLFVATATVLGFVGGYLLS